MTGLRLFKEKYFSPIETPSSRINNFNFIRFIAAIMVLYGHMGPIMGLPQFVICGQAVSTLGVKIFFIISGYLITKSYLNDNHFGRYMIRRCFRIFPGLIGVVCFVVFVLGPITTAMPLAQYFRDPGTKMYFRNILMFPVYTLPGVFTNYTYPNAINGSLWSLPVEFTLYLILPVVLIAFRKMKNPKIGVLCVALLVSVADLVHIIFSSGARCVVWGNNLPDWLALIPFFFIGSFFSFPEMKKYLNFQLGTAMMIGIALFSFSYEISEVLLLLVLPYFILSFALIDRPIFGNWFSKCDFSYGLYLYGFIIQQLFYHQFQKCGCNPTMNQMMFICFIITLFCAVVSWYLIEKPAQKLGKMIIKKIGE